MADGNQFNNASAMAEFNVEWTSWEHPHCHRCTRGLPQVISIALVPNQVLRAEYLRMTIVSVTVGNFISEKAEHNQKMQEVARLVFRNRALA
jgi:hypothetical protein